MDDPSESGRFRVRVNATTSSSVPLAFETLLSSFASVTASDGVTEVLHGVTSPLHGALPFFFERYLATRMRVCSRDTVRVTKSLYLGALSTIHPPVTRSILRPSLSGSDEFSSGASRIRTASTASDSSTRARWERLATDARATNPSSSIPAIRVSQTMRVGVGSSQMEESSILVKSLLYTGWV